MKTEKAKRGFLEAKQGLSPRTLEQYAQGLDHLQRECPKMPKKPEPIRRALGKAGTIWVKDAYWRTWSAFFHWCSREYDTSNPMERVERPQCPDIEMRALEPEELALVLAAADNLRDKSILALALDSGVRASEFSGLRILDIGTDTIRVMGKGNRQARIPMSPEMHYLLRRLADQDGKNGPQSHLFLGRNGQPLSRFGIYRIVRQCMERAGITGPKLGPHCLRHSLGKNYIADGGDAFTLRKVMRHKNITTTQKYVNLAMQDVVEQHHKHSPLRPALRGTQGVLWRRQVEEVLEKA
ncbi:hypothetical protein LCGC14_1504860 [marine sediment metagenome]|uniref:Tyr recombinase domain-containing protein n=1 Tax=marine sediment metagenome TaxID=412755 RepID=A0A0F9JNS8_9ZZZZ